ncbi:MULTISPECIES: ABC transporter permease [unclassified Shinella]|uniref:ABC transporter permease n=1 Tax=unclassified Shinella TaxID=2643062 RepID=UPI00225CB170|nr:MULTISPECIES: ABC transporter permease [unclassified Shinella]CAI0334900.1 Spermidine Putrescine ABC transporter permease component potB (TC_3.A.1.11.1) [Rhizobiaceae bacterium]CAK7260323.1 spermidine/putrescine transport system permease protein [Shinella sp. WSC3-e]MCO5139804.1 ABC transporter permease [Shinella sp.]MCW5708853.1 ABC transporter permease [Shinella sp.]MDC7258559.1 ABC transporter permease [Shinella sp. YE25]
MSVAFRRLCLLSPALLVILLLVGVPLCLMAWVSLLDKGGSAGVDWSSAPSAANYVRLVWEEDFDGTMILNTGYLVIFLRSVALAAVTTVLSLALGLPVALWMASLSRTGRDVMLLLITIPFWTNLLVRNYAWLIILREDGWVSQFVNMLSPWPVQLLYNDAAVAIGLTYSFLPFTILPLYTVFEKFDWRLLEAAHDLGATRRRALRRVVLPIATPGIVAGALLVFIPCLGAFVTPALLGGGKTLMLGNIIQMQFGASRNWPFGATLAVVLLAIMLVVMTAMALWRNRRTA